MAKLRRIIIRVINSVVVRRYDACTMSLLYGCHALKHPFPHVDLSDRYIVRAVLTYQLSIPPLAAKIVLAERSQHLSK